MIHFQYHVSPPFKPCFTGPAQATPTTLLSILKYVIIIILSAGLGISALLLFLWWKTLPTPSPVPPSPDIIISSELHELDHYPGVVKAQADSVTPELFWELLDSPKDSHPYYELQSNGKDLLFFSQTQGTYTFLIEGIVGSKITKVRTKVLIGPTPVPPVPPVPPPTPEAGLRVLIIYDSANASKLTPAQEPILYGTEIRTYLNSKCTPGKDGKTPEWRIWDKDIDASNESQVWQDLQKHPHSSLPWIIISNGKTGFEGPLPDTLPNTMTLLKKYEQ